MGGVRVRVRVRVRVEISVNPYLRNEPNTTGDTGSTSGLSSCISNPPIPSLLSMASNKANLIKMWNMLSYGAGCNLSIAPWKDPGLRHTYRYFNRLCLSARMGHRDALQPITCKAISGPRVLQALVLSARILSPFFAPLSLHFQY